MPILDLQKKMAEAGRIRMGEKRVSQKSGKEYPAKLDTFRLTSKHREVIDDAAEVYGGNVEAFNDGQWAVTTTTRALDVVVPPGAMSFSQWNEMWGNGFCIRRCDGHTEMNSDGPCQCPADPAERAALATKGKACKATTRLSVMLPDLTGFGLWRLESHGYYAATELNGAIDVIQTLAPGTLVRGRLYGDPRSVVRFDKDGNPQTQNFIVPVLDLADVRLSALMAPSGDGVSVQIETQRSGLSAVPVAELPEGPRPTVAEQLAQPDEPKKKRANAAAEIPATGLKTGPKGGVNDDDEPVEAEIVNDSEWAATQKAKALWDQHNPKARALQAEAGWDEDRWHETIRGLTEERTQSSKELTEGEWADLLALLATAADEAPGGGGGSSPPAALAGLIAEGRTNKAGALKRARRIAGERGVDSPLDFDGIDDDLAAAVAAELAA